MPRLLVRTALGITAGAAGFVGYNYWATGDHLANIAETDVPEGSVFQFPAAPVAAPADGSPHEFPVDAAGRVQLRPMEAGVLEDCYELCVPKAFFSAARSDADRTSPSSATGLSSSTSASSHGSGRFSQEDALVEYVRAFNNAPIMMLERCITAPWGDGRFPPRDLSHETFQPGTRVGFWTVGVRRPRSVLMYWGTPGSAVGTSNFGVVSGPTSDYVTLRFGSTITTPSEMAPGLVWLHSCYSRILLAQAARQLEKTAAKTA